MTHPEQTASSGTERGRIVVKPLNWEDCDDLGLCADTVVGRYWMEPDELATSSWQLRLITIEHEEESQIILAREEVSAHATQAFAAADFKRRILSAIESPDLIAAAPTMLEALKNAKLWLEDWGSGETHMSIIDAAIALAEGRTPTETKGGASDE